MYSWLFACSFGPSAVAKIDVPLMTDLLEVSPSVVRAIAIDVVYIAGGVLACHDYPYSHMLEPFAPEGIYYSVIGMPPLGPEYAACSLPDKGSVLPASIQAAGIRVISELLC